MDPGAKVQIVWTNSWYNPGAEKKAAESLVAAGACVLGQNVDSPATGEYAQSQHIPWVGYDSDSSKFARKSWLTASVYNWGLYELKQVKAAMNGKWKPAFYYGTINDGFTKLAPYGPGVTKATKAKIASVEKKIENGTFYEFTGPLYDQKGKLRVKPGVKMQVLKGGTNSLYGMNWLVKGVIGSAKG
jgi:basic membrane protein A